MKSIRIKQITLLLLLPMLLLVVIGACKRSLSKDEMIGNERLVSAPEGFSGIQGGSVDLRIVYTDPMLVSFSDQTYDAENPANPFLFGRDTGGDRIYFKNKLSHNVTWFIKLKGVTSGAQKTYSATSDSIGRTYAFIDGSTDGTRFFLPGEKITYSLSFLGSSIKYEGTLITLDAAFNSAKKYQGLILSRPGAAPITYFCIDDMEPNGYGAKHTGSPGIRTSYRDAADNNNAIFYVITDKAVDGHFSYYMKATDYNRNTYCGGFGGETLNEMYGATTETDPAKVYINAYIYGYGRANSAIAMLLFEDDFWNPGDAIPNVRPDATKNDMWFSIVQVDWVGWKLVSIPYSSFRSANNPNSGGSGNRIKEPHKLAGMGMELDSYPVGGSTVELALDVVYLTTNGAFQP